MCADPKEAEKQIKKIRICADDWLNVFALLAPSLLGLRIAIVSHRFDCFVDEHFETRRWALGPMRIWRRIGKDGTKRMEIANPIDGRPLPMPQRQLPSRVIGFEGIAMTYVDQNAVEFLRHFRQLFGCCAINLAIEKINGLIALQYFLCDIWPMIKDNICGIVLWSANDFRRLRQFGPPLLRDCPSLRSVTIGHFVPEFPADDSANASDAQMLAKWLFSSSHNCPPKLLRCHIHSKSKWTPTMEGFGTAFLSATSPASFIVLFVWRAWPGDTAVPFDLTNELTGERLTLHQYEQHRLSLIRCPIARDETAWAKWEKEAKEWRFEGQWNKMSVAINDEHDGGANESLLVR